MSTRCFDFDFSFEPQEDQTVLIRELNNQEFVIVPEDTPTLREDVVILGQIYLGLPRKMRRNYDNSLGLFMAMMLSSDECMQSVRTSFAFEAAQNATKH